MCYSHRILSLILFAQYNLIHNKNSVFGESMQLTSTVHTVVHQHASRKKGDLPLSADNRQTATLAKISRSCENYEIHEID